MKDALHKLGYLLRGRLGIQRHNLCHRLVVPHDDDFLARLGARHIFAEMRFGIKQSDDMHRDSFKLVS